VGLDSSEIIFFLLLFRSYEFDFEILCIDGMRSKEHVGIFFIFFMNFDSSFVHWLHEMFGGTWYVPCFLFIEHVTYHRIESLPEFYIKLTSGTFIQISSFTNYKHTIMSKYVKLPSSFKYIWNGNKVIMTQIQCQELQW
jgi:hypothetical protein